MTPFHLRQLAYDLGSGLFARPAAWILALGGLALILPQVEVRVAPNVSAFFATEPAAAQVVLGTLAGSMMTVVSVVYSILLVALSLASIQFSTRILANFARDQVSQHILGLFVGTFVYCLLVLRSVHAEPEPVVPGVALTGAMLLALGSLGGLVWFIHHVVQSIQANHIVDRIAAATEDVIDEVFPEPLVAGEIPIPAAPPSIPAIATTVYATRSGYVQGIDEEVLRGMARDGRTVQILPPMGTFVAEGLPLALLAPDGSEAEVSLVRAAVDLGPVRTMQSDVEFGFRQIVDIALKAISPAVNDPSTAATCIDHLGRLLIRAAGRRPTPVARDGVTIPRTTLSDLVDLAFEQLRQYGRTDMAVALRMMRIIGEVASVTRDPACVGRLELHAKLIEGQIRSLFAAEDCDELTRRRAIVKQHTASLTPEGARP